jgi:hypothetical protein
VIKYLIQPYKESSLADEVRPADMLEFDNGNKGAPVIFLTKARKWNTACYVGMPEV